MAAMVQLQLLTGMRAGGGPDAADGRRLVGPALWAYSPARHKTQHRGDGRQIFLGERCQVVLLPFMDRDRAAYPFSPAEAVGWHLARRTAARVTPASCGNKPGDQRRRAT